MKIKVDKFGGYNRLVDDKGKAIDFLAFKSFRPTENNVSDFYREGVRVFHVYCSGLRSAIKMYYSLFGECWCGDGQYCFENFDRQMDFFIENAPDAYLFVNIQLDVRDWWLAENEGRPNSFTHLSQIAGDEKWRRDTAEYMKALIKHAEEKYNGKILGYWLLGGYTTEWFSHDDYEESHPIKLEAYRKYMNDESIDIPTKERLTRPGEEIFLDPKADKDIINYRRFHSELITDTVLYYAKEAQSVLCHTKPIGVFSGYIMELVGGTVWDFGQIAVDRLNESDDIDMIATPSSYKLRAYDDCGGYMILTDSIIKHSKMYSSSYDNATYIARTSLDHPRRICNDEETVEAYRRLTGGYYQRNDDLKTLEQTKHTMRREMMHRFIKRSGTWWFDMIEGWYYDDGLMREVSSLVKLSEKYTDVASTSASEIAVFVCSESLYYVNKHSHISDDLLVCQRSALGHIGAPYDLFSISDLDKIDLEKYKLLIFPNEYYMSDKTREYINNSVKRNGRTLLFVGAPDYTSDEGLSLRRTEDMLGMKLGVLERDECRVGACGSVYGNIAPKSPTLYVDDADADVIGRFSESRTCGLARKRMKDHTVYFSSVGRISDKVLTHIARDAGVHIYADDNVAVYASSLFVGVYNTKDEYTTLTLTREGEFTEIFSGKKYKTENRKITLPTGECPAQMLVLI